TTGNQIDPSVGMDAAGDFVVAWQSYGQDGSFWGIYAQRYNAAGAPQGSEFRVNTYTTDDQRLPAVAVSAAGDFIVSGNGSGQGIQFAIFVHRFAAKGVVVGGECRVHTATNNTQISPAVAMDAAGDCLIAWSSNQDPTAYGVYAQRYSASGLPLGGE